VDIMGWAFLGFGFCLIGLMIWIVRPVVRDIDKSLREIERLQRRRKEEGW
jgi:hypothetical protein